MDELMMFPELQRGEVIPACGDIDSCAHAPCRGKTPISPWTAGRFCNGCLGGGAGSMSQGLRVLILYTASWCRRIRPRGSKPFSDSRMGRHAPARFGASILYQPPEIPIRLMGASSSVTIAPRDCRGSSPVRHFP